jgi:hypothetical protein
MDSVSESSVISSSCKGAAHLQRPADRVVEFARDGDNGFGPRVGHRNQAALTAIMLGAVGAIAGTAVLVYANRPDCNVNPNLGGCGYGTKVVGASVLSGGVVGLMVGAVMWR